MRSTFPPGALRLAAALLLAPFGLRAAAVPAAAPTLILLDGSGSMRERTAGSTKIEAARRAVRDLVAALPDGTPLGLVVYSHRKPRACDDLELVIPAGPLDRAKFVAAVDAIKPQGNTPLAASLRFAAEAADYTNQPVNLVLVSDGVETCGGDPCTTVLELQKRAAKLVVHAVAFDLSAQDAKSFECLAATTGGRFLPAHDAASLTDALVTVVQEAAAATPPPPEKLGDATVAPPASVAAGATFSTAWTGPANAGDFLTIVPAGARDDDFGNHAYVRQGNPLGLTAPIEAGAAEVRYVTSRSRKVLARAPVSVTPIAIELDAPPSAIAGAPVEISWQGPANRGDYVTIVPRGTPDTEYGNYSYADAKSRVGVTAPIVAGDAEIRYVSGQGRRILARRPIAVTAADVTLDAPADAIAGAPVSIAWRGPGNRGDYLTIAPPGAPDQRAGAYAYVDRVSPLAVSAPMEPGSAEIRYVSGQGAKILARRAITITAATITLDAPASAVRGAAVAVAWTGPDNRGDYITLVPVGTPDDRYGPYTYTSQGSPLRVTAPLSLGAHELRYISGQGARVLARRSVGLEAAVIELRPPAQAAADALIEIAWVGPNHPGDYLTIVPRDQPDGRSGHYDYTRGGSPAKLRTPKTPGPAEVRYVSSQGNVVLARAPLEIAPAGAQP